jgi:hypothetical protein
MYMKLRKPALLNKYVYFSWEYAELKKNFILLHENALD